MFTIHIELKPSTDSQEEQDARLAGHRTWFSKNFEAGNFLVVGPYADLENAGFILAQAENRETLETILAEDSYYPDGADYVVHEVTAKMVANNIPDYKN